MQMHNKEVLDMRSQADLLYNEQNCYSEQNSVEENCMFDQYTACGDSCQIIPYSGSVVKTKI